MSADLLSELSELTFLTGNSFKSKYSVTVGHFVYQPFLRCPADPVVPCEPMEPETLLD